VPAFREYLQSEYLFVQPFVILLTITQYSIFAIVFVHSQRVATAIQSVESVESTDEKIGYLERIIDRMSVEERTSRIGGAVFEALISVYGSQGLFDEALRTFETIVGRVDGPCLRAILLACSTASPARWLDAATILHTSDIVEGTSGPGKVDQIALGNAIIACGKADQFEEGLNLLQLYGIPERQRYD
jgi:pentatricopeptide repeat protein